MKFKSLYAENIYSFKKLSLNFLDYAGATTIILGKNLDQKTANGAGKTSILKALFYGLWGKDLYGANLDDIINRLGKDGLIVRIEFEDRGNEYVITRYKDYKNINKGLKDHDEEYFSGSGVEFLVNGNPLHGDTHTNTQKIIEQKLRMSPRLFLSSVLMSQNSKEHFLTAKDTDKKELLTELLDLTAYAKAFESVKKDIKEKEDKITQLEGRIEVIRQQYENNLEQKDSLKKSEEGYELEKTQKLASLILEQSSLKEELKLLKPKAQAKDSSQELRQEVANLEAKIAKVKKNLEFEVVASSALSSLDKELENFKKNKTDLIARQEKNEREQSDLNKIKIDNQDTSFNEIELTNLETLEKELKNEISALELKEKSRQELLLKIQKIEHQVEKLTQDAESLNHAIKESKDNALCLTCLRKFDDGSLEMEAMIAKLKVQAEQNSEALSALNLDLSALNKEKSLSDGLSQDILSAKSKLASEQEKISGLKTKRHEVALRKQKLDLVSKQLEDLQTTAMDLVAQIAQNDKLSAVASNKKTEVEKLLKQVEPLKNELKTLEGSLAIKNQELMDSQVSNQSLHQIKQQLQDKETRLNQVDEEMNQLKNKENPFSAYLKKLEESTNKNKSDLDKAGEMIKSLQDELRYLNFWKLGFAPTGIRSFITDDVIDLLNRKVQDNLNTLFDGALTVSFDPESKNKKGEVSNKISTHFYLNGKETSFELLSGGEQYRCILATELALTDVAESRSGTKLNLRFLDEPFTGIDDNGQSKALTLFARLSREKDGFFVISHDEKFQNLCQKAVYVVKSREVSQTVERAEFDKIAIDQKDVDFSAGFDEGENLELLAPTKKKIDLSKVMEKKKKQLEDDDD